MNKMNDYISNCCNAGVTNPNNGIGICTDCKEWCEAIEVFEKPDEFYKDIKGEDTIFMTDEWFEYVKDQAVKVVNIMLNRPLNQWDRLISQIEDIDWCMVWRMIHQDMEVLRDIDWEFEKEMDIRCDIQADLMRDFI